MPAGNPAHAWETSSPSKKKLFLPLPSLLSRSHLRKCKQRTQSLIGAKLRRRETLCCATFVNAYQAAEARLCLPTCLWWWSATKKSTFIHWLVVTPLFHYRYIEALHAWNSADWFLNKTRICLQRMMKWTWLLLWYDSGQEEGRSLAK